MEIPSVERKGKGGFVLPTDFIVLDIVNNVDKRSWLGLMRHDEALDGVYR